MKIKNIVYNIGTLPLANSFFYVSVMYKFVPLLRGQIPKLSIMCNYSNITVS